MKRILALLAVMAVHAACAQPVVGVCATPDKTCVGQVVSEFVITTNNVTGAMIVAALPPNAVLHSIDILNTTGNAVTGGVNIGTTAGASDVVSALAIAANAQITVQPAGLSKQYISPTLVQPLYISAVTAWASASLNIRVRYGQ